MNMQYTNELTPEIRAELAHFSFAKYADGSTAKIVSGAHFLHESEGKGVALVGSLLDNGDEIISTPQNISLLTACEGIPVADDFLTSVALETGDKGEK